MRSPTRQPAPIRSGEVRHLPKFPTNTQLVYEKEYEHVSRRGDMFFICIFFTSRIEVFVLKYRMSH